MRKGLFTLALAVGVLMGTRQAGADDITPPANGPTPGTYSQPGGLLVYAWNDTRSIIEYLGRNFDDVSTSNLEAPGTTLNFGTLGHWSDLMGGTGQTYYAVVAGTSGDVFSDNKLAVSGGPGVAGATITTSGALIGIGALDEFINRMNKPNGGDLTNGCNAVNPCVALAATDFQYAGDPANFGNDLGGLGVNISAQLGQALGFYALTTTSANDFDPFAVVDVHQYQNASGIGSWLLSQSGNLTYSIGAVSSVPLPAAVWLLLSGLAGMTAVRRRKVTAAA